MKSLLHSFRNTWTAAFDCDSDALMIFKHLETKYSMQHRHYHTFNHVADCIRIFERCESDTATFDMNDVATTIKLALWFHDVVYEMDTMKDRTRKGNEMRSAASFLDIAADYNEKMDDIASNVVEAILATRYTHSEDYPPMHSAFTMDADLAGLGADYETFLLNQTRVRMEFSGLTDLEFRNGQANFLRDHFLNRDRIYHTEWFRNKFEKQARENLTRYCETR